MSDPHADVQGVAAAAREETEIERAHRLVHEHNKAVLEDAHARMVAFVDDLKQIEASFPAGIGHVKSVVQNMVEKVRANTEQVLQNEANHLRDFFGLKP